MPVIDGIPYPRLHNGKLINGPADFPLGVPPQELREAYGTDSADSEDCVVLEFLNQGTEQDLVNIKGVGQKTAADILASREAEGPFQSLEDCAKRVGGVSLKQLKAYTG
jgi:DNA uptake protein ComE-like DNA-binding protein